MLGVTIVKQAHIITIITNKLSNEAYYFHIVHIVNACFYNVGTRHRGKEQDLALPEDTVTHVTSVTTEEDVKIPETYYQELIAYRDSFKVLKDRYLNLEKVHNKLMWQKQSIEDSLRMYKIQCDDAQEQNKSLMDKTIKNDKALISMSSNFIYIPYEAYSVDSIAIPAYESVQDLVLKRQYEIRYQLLKNYKENVSETVKLLNDIFQECNAPFASGGQSNELISKITQSRVYAQYKQYDDWRNTYLGYMLTEVVGYLKAFNKETTSQKIKAKIDELNRCIKTEYSL